MLSFFRRGPPPAIHEPLPPPPSRAARIEKEKRWYDSISGKGGKAEVDKGRAVDKEREKEAARERKLKTKTSSSSLRSSATRKSSFFSNPLLGKSSPHLLPSSSPDPALHLGVNGAPRSIASSTGRGSAFFRSRKTTTDDSTGLILPSPRAAYAASAPPPRTKKDSSFTTTPPLPSQLPTPQTDVSTQYLATRLQELAVANSDGLLDDEEYRMLRTQLFERYAKVGPGASGTGEMLGEGNEEVPILNGRGECELVAEAQRADRVAAVTERTPSSVNVPPTPSRVAALATTSGPSRSPSFLSTKSRAKSTTAISSLFRRNTSSMRSGAQPIGEDWDVVQPNRVDVSSILSGKTGRSRTSVIPTEEHPIFRTRSVRNHPALASSALSSRGEGSSRSSNGGRGGTSVYSTEGSTHYGARSSLSHSPSRTRGSTIQSSRSRLDSVSYSSPFLPLPPLASSTDPFIFASSDREPSSSELKAEIHDIENESGRLGESWDALERAAVEKWEERIGPGGLTAMENAMGRNGLRAPEGDGASNGAVPTRKKSLMRKASFTLSKRPSPPATPSASTFDLSSALEQRNPVGLSEDAERATQALRDELEEVRRRRRATEGKYEERLEYLRARLKGAIIRERLPR